MSVPHKKVKTNFMRQLKKGDSNLFCVRNFIVMRWVRCLLLLSSAIGCHLIISK